MPLNFHFNSEYQKTLLHDAITDFEGIERRLEKIGSFRQMDVYDDYAHNPMKIEATITALKEAYPQHAMHVIWRPHAFKSLSNQFDAYLELFHRFSSKDEYCTITPTRLLCWRNSSTRKKQVKTWQRNL